MEAGGKVIHPKYYKHLKKAAGHIRKGWFLSDYTGGQNVWVDRPFY